jgi:hypothetical protein
MRHGRSRLHDRSLRLMNEAMSGLLLDCRLRMLILLAHASSCYPAAEIQHHVVVERTGVRLLIGDAQFRQQLQNDVRLDFEFSSQLVDANFTHT